MKLRCRGRFGALPVAQLAHANTHTRTLRRGFTLMEIMTALAITGVVAALAASALHAALDVRERVETHRVTIETEARAVSWLATMLRHAPDASAVDEAMLTVTHNVVGESDISSDGLTFLSKGVESPFGTGPVWRVTLSVHTDGLHVFAQPVSASSNRIPFESVLPHVRAMRVAVLDNGGGVTSDATWRSDWPVLRSMPRAVQLSFALRDGTMQRPVVFDVSPLAGALN